MNKSKKIKIYAITLKESIANQENQVFKDWFLKTIKDDFELFIDEIQMGHGDFRSKNFNAFCLRRFEILRDAIKENQGDIIISADLDIQFFDKTEPIVRSSLKNKDIVFQMGTPLNIGFMGIICNEKTYKMFSDMCDSDWNNFGGDQGWIIDAMETNRYNLKWGTFPNVIWTPKFEKFPPVGIVLHHAIQTGEAGAFDKDKRIIIKLEQLKRIRAFVENRKRSSVDKFRVSRLINFLGNIKKIKYGIRKIPLLGRIFIEKDQLEMEIKQLQQEKIHLINERDRAYREIDKIRKEKTN